MTASSTTRADTARYSCGFHREELCGSSSHLCAFTHTDDMAMAGAYFPPIRLYMDMRSIMECIFAATASESAGFSGDISI